MGSLVLRPPIYEQPREVVAVDWGNPLTQGLIAAVLPGVGSVLSDTSLSGAPSLSADPQGESWRFNGAGSPSHIEATGTPRILTGQPFTVLVDATWGGQTTDYVWVSQGGSGSGRGWSMNNYAAIANNEFALTFGSVANYTPASESLTSGVRAMIGVRVLATSATYFKDGKELNTITIGAMSATAATRDFTLGAAHNNVSYEAWLEATSSVGVVLLWNRALSAEEVASVSADPWQLFAPTYSIWGPGTAASSGIARSVFPFFLR